MEISIEPWKKLVIHEIIEYDFGDWVKQIAFSTRSSGGGIPTMQWTNGIVFSPSNFPTTNATIDEQLKGILHWSSVSFAIKEKFEHQIVKDLNDWFKGDTDADLISFERHLADFADLVIVFVESPGSISLLKNSLLGRMSGLFGEA